MNQPLTVPAGRDVRLADFDPDFSEGLDRAEAEAETRKHCDKLDELAYRLFAEAKRAVVVVLQGIDTSGKDGTIRMIASGVRAMIAMSPASRWSCCLLPLRDQYSPGASPSPVRHRVTAQCGTVS